MDPPDLVLEIDITSPSINKLPIYAQLGVPEVWRYDGRKLTVLTLENTEYAEVNESTTLKPLTGATLTDFVEKGKTMKRTAWLKSVREWARQRSG